MRVYTVLFFALLFASCHSSAQQQTQLKKVIIIRHGEKPENGDNLSCKGLNRALQLPAVINKKFGIPNHIFVPAINTGKSTSTARMYQTAVPLAVKYNLTINTKYDVRDAKDLVQDVLKKNGTVLIVWEHDNIDNILKAFGMKDASKWPGDDFDSIWIVSFQNGKVEFSKEKEGINPPDDCK